MLILQLLWQLILLIQFSLSQTQPPLLQRQPLLLIIFLPQLLLRDFVFLHLQLLRHHPQLFMLQIHDLSLVLRLLTRQHSLERSFSFNQIHHPSS